VVEIDVDLEACPAALISSSPLPSPALCHACDLACATRRWHRRLHGPVDNAGVATT
jgi:hypothetical protein